MNCKNCNALVEQKFCPNCGQKAQTGRITLSGLIKELPHAVFHVDKGFLYNVLQLFTRPGPAIIDFLEGKRKPFFHPASYLVIALVLNYLVVKITDLHFYDEGELSGMDPVAAQALKDYDGLQWWFLEHTYIYILIAIPASTLFLYLIFRSVRRTYNVAETAVIVLFTIAQGVLIQTTIYTCFGWIDSGPVRRTIESINLAILILYASYVIFQLVGKDRSKWIRGIFSLLGGIGLAAVWIASAYVLYILLT
jgi:hypothetical protein